MVVSDLMECGWCRDLPDHRDYTQQHSVVRKMLRKIAPLSAKHPFPLRVDWREYFPPVQDQQDQPTSSAHACIGLIQYFERRSSGRVLTPSRLFLHANARRLSGRKGDSSGVGLRDTLKAAVTFGLPPERYWPYDSDAIDQTPDAYLYGIDTEYRNVRYARLDAATQSSLQTLGLLKSYLAGGFCCVLGLGVPSLLTDEPEIPYPSLFDSIRTGHAVTVVGFDDELRIRSERGALLIRSSWGEKWGMGGYGWLPYRYVTDQLSSDIWTVLKRRWLKSGEFHKPL